MTSVPAEYLPFRMIVHNHGVHLVRVVKFHVVNIEILLRIQVERVVDGGRRRRDVLDQI